MTDQKPQEPDLSCEFSFLGTILAHPRLVSKVSDFKPEFFLHPLHSRIFADLLSASGRGETTSAIVIISRFSNDESLVSSDQTSAQYVAGLLRQQEHPNSLFSLRDQIKDEALRRLVVESAAEISQAASVTMAGETVADVISFALDKINAIATDAGSERKQSRFTLFEAVDGVTTRVNDVIVGGVVPDSVVGCGSQFLDDALGGFRGGRLYIIAGRPGMCKTTVAQSWLMQSAKKGANVAFFSLEMNADELGERALSDECLRSGERVEYKWIARNDLKTAQLESVMDAQHNLQDVPFTVFDRAGLTIGQIRALATQEQQRLKAAGKKLDVVCIDHLGKVKASDRYKGNMVAETEELSGELKNMAKDLDVAVVALSQLNRKVEERDNKRPMMSDLRWSGSIEQDADVIMFCYREEYYLLQMRCDDDYKELDRLANLDKCKNKLEIQVAKNRNGEMKTMDFYIDAGCSAVRDLQ